MNRGTRTFFFPLLLFIVLPAWPYFATKLPAQESPHGRGEPLSFVGMKVEELIERFGPPRAVLAARGNELWQDDVVFQYTEGEFYVFRDRVWQIKIASVRGVSLRDSKPVALLVLGDEAEDRGDHLLLPLPGGAWPLMLRVNFNNAGLISAIFVYRPDF